jgi:uncharacterized protein (TIGR03382 family)
MAADYLARKQEALGSAQRIAARQANADTAPAPAWRNIGPFRGQPSYGSFGGRLRAIVPHPTDSHILYIAAAGGGVWKTTDATPATGSVWTWRPLTDGIPAVSASGNIAVGGLAMDAGDPETLYLALGDPFQPGGARGFFVTHDGGATWQNGGFPEGASDVVYTVFSPSPRTVLVATEAGLWRSADGGGSFAVIPLGGVASVYSVAQFGDGTLACAAGSPRSLNTVFLFSTDAGASWTPAAMPAVKMGRATIATSRASGWAIASGLWELLGGVLHSTDSGRSWSWIPASNIDPWQGSYNQAIAVDPDDPGRVVVGTRQSFQSTNAGLNWTFFAYTHPDLHAASWWAAAPKRLLLGHDGGLTVVENPWDLYSLRADSSHNDGAATQLAYAVSGSLAPAADGSRDQVAVGLQDNGCLRGRATTGSFDAAWGGDGFAVLLHPADSRVLLCGVNGTGMNGRILRIEEGSATPSEIPDLPFGVRLFPDESDATGDTVYTLGWHAVYRSSDFGRTWTRLGNAGWSNDFVPFAFASSRDHPGTLFVMSGQLTGFLTRDGGTTWTKISGPRGHAGIWSAWIEQEALYVASPLQDTTTHHLWKSLDWGRTWQTADSGLPPLPVWKVRSDPGAAWVLWAGTDVGVYRSGDAGRSWSRFGSGLPWVAVRDVYVAPDDSVLRVATYGRGIWEVPIAKPDDPPPSEPPPAPQAHADSGGCSSSGATGLWAFILLAFAVGRGFSGSRATGRRNRSPRATPRTDRP